MAFHGNRRVVSTTALDPGFQPGASQQGSDLRRRCCGGDVYAGLCALLSEYLGELLSVQSRVRRTHGTARAISIDSALYGMSVTRALLPSSRSFSGSNDDTVPLNTDVWDATQAGSMEPTLSDKPSRRTPRAKSSTNMARCVRCSLCDAVSSACQHTVLCTCRMPAHCPLHLHCAVLSRSKATCDSFLPRSRLQRNSFRTLYFVAYLSSVGFSILLPTLWPRLHAVRVPAVCAVQADNRLTGWLALGFAGRQNQAVLRNCSVSVLCRTNHWRGVSGICGGPVRVPSQSPGVSCH